MKESQYKRKTLYLYGEHEKKADGIRRAKWLKKEAKARGMNECELIRWLIDEEVEKKHITA